MFHYFILVLLAPLFFIQGRHVRNVTQVLPEASGGRSGCLGDGTPLRLLVIGDSAAAGVGVETQDEALCGRLTNILSKRFRLDWSLLAKSGYKTLDLITILESLPATEYDVVLISLGVNDLLSPLSSWGWQGQQLQLVKLLKSKFLVKHILLTSVPPMGAFPAFPQPLSWFLGQRAKEFNRKLATLISDDTHCELINIPLAPSVSDMACDGFHPGTKIYKLWGDVAADIIHRRTP
ncbi:SGNH/GDSL hydrolase family protein [Shewanella violacea]|uniref:GDSL-like lipase/acylhydrolase domain protein n=1 Tax=Shewanella violacea (strain JCM 10179 / CIP 106290 / LMG 19151 / DSS12) TaxID=637905 RepID=D4ZHS5_SHEVD|nr:SGNH/GDSL hydrolase family protein [Shewanella violacea]BAJ01224.1 GDSL-like lipase/acylhydrolase domain protein [Shewanella violacea DSS12]